MPKPIETLTDTDAAALRSALFGYLLGPLVSGEWKPITGLPRLKLSGVGTVTIDANTEIDGSGTTTAAVFTATVSGAQTAFPFFGLDAVAVRATYTGTANAEII